MWPIEGNRRVQQAGIRRRKPGLKTRLRGGVRESGTGLM
jgi:hypothetical protein